MNLYLEGPSGRLEALWELPEGEPRAAAVVCHPHPRPPAEWRARHGPGGTMHNTVVVRTARGLRRAGVATLRFNFRGVERSDGKYDGAGGEERDAAAALDWLEHRVPGVELWGAGFSFGARTIAGLARRDRRLARLVLIALPVSAYALPHVTQLSQPTHLVFAGDDEFGTLREFRDQVGRMPRHFHAVEVPGTDHFFRNKTPDLEEAVFRHASQALGTPA